MNQKSSNYKFRIFADLRPELGMLVFSPDGKYLLKAWYDVEVYKFYEDRLEFYKKYTPHQRHVRTIEFTPDSRFIASGSADRTIAIVSVQDDFKIIKRIEGFADTISRLIFSPNSKFLAAICDDGTVSVYSVDDDFKLIQKLTDHKKDVALLEFSADSRFLGTTALDGSIVYEIVQTD